MSAEKRAMTLLAHANPEPEDETLAESSATAYLAALRARSREVTEPIETKRRGGLRLPVLGLAIATFVVLVGAVVLLGPFDGEPEVAPSTDSTQAAPTTEAATPTTAVPTTEPVGELAGEEEVAVAERLIAARISGDVDEVAEVMAGPLSMGFVTSSTVLDQEKAWRDAVGWTIESAECTLENPSPENTQVDCQTIHQTDIGRALGIGPFFGNFNVNVRSGETNFGFFEDPVAYDVQDRFDDAEFISQVWRPFFDWVETNHPDEVTRLFRHHSDGSPYVGLAFLTKQIYPNFVSEELVELWRQRTAEYIAEVTG